METNAVIYFLDNYKELWAPMDRVILLDTRNMKIKCIGTYAQGIQG